MKYRKFGKMGWEVSALGFGAMRLPLIDKTDQIDEELATAMIHKAIDHGVNYVDTAWGYHNEKSEPFIGKVLKGGYREKVHLATKLPVWLVKTESDPDRLLDEQQRRLDVEHIDLYLLHALGVSRWDELQKVKILDWAERKKSEGRFSYFGFSFHDDHDAFIKILDGYDAWDFCQVQHNYMDIEHQQGQAGVNEAAARGLGVVVMEPIRGGNLALDPMPQSVMDVFAHTGRDWKPAEWALQWVWNQPQVSVVLSGMSTMQHVDENLISADRSGIGSFSESDLAAIDEVRKAFYSLTPIPCTQCNYCQPCPSDVAIPSIFALYNDAKMYGAEKGNRWMYTSHIKEENRADMCIECGQCEAACPQQIEIISWLKTCDAFFAK